MQLLKLATPPNGSKINFNKLCCCEKPGCLMAQVIDLGDCQIPVTVRPGVNNLTADKSYVTHNITTPRGAKHPEAQIVGDDETIVRVSFGTEDDEECQVFVKNEDVERFHADISELKKDGLFEVLRQAVDIFDRARDPDFEVGDVVQLRPKCRFDNTIGYGDLVYVTEFFNAPRDEAESEIPNFRGIMLDGALEFTGVCGDSKRFEKAAEKYQLKSSK